MKGVYRMNFVIQSAALFSVIKDLKIHSEGNALELDSPLNSIRYEKP